MKEGDQWFGHTEFKITMGCLGEDNLIGSQELGLENRREAGIQVTGLGITLTLQVVEAAMSTNDITEEEYLK